MNDPKTLWKTQAMEENRMMTLSDIRARANRFQSHVRMRNVALYAYSLANIVASAWLLSTGRFSAFLYPMLLMVAAHLLVLWQVNRRISARPVPGDMAGKPALDFYRDELKRQADALSNAWFWYILPFMPPFLWELAIWMQRIQARAAAASDEPNYAPFILCIIGAVFFWTAVWLAFSRASLKARMQIDRLDALKAE
jgi:hypothetical protein